METTKRRVRVVWHYQAQDEERTFTIAYRFRSLAVAHDDVVDVNLKVWGGSWSVPVEALRAEMVLPKPVSVANPLYRAWGAPASVHGVVTRSRRGAVLQASNVPAHQYVELRTVFPRRLLASTAGAQAKAGTGFQKVTGAAPAGRRQ